MNCPKCKQKACMARPKAHDLAMICANTLPDGKKCDYHYTDEEAEFTLGIKKVPAFIDGEMRDSFENTGGKWELFPSPYCLKYFVTYDERVLHDKTYHKIGDFMACCIPSGFTTIVPECGD